MCAYALGNSELSAIAPAYIIHGPMVAMDFADLRKGVYIGRPAAQTL